MQLENFELEGQYLVRTTGTSDGTQDKYFKDNRWFKLDRYGGEGFAEYTASLLLKESGLDESKFVEYTPCLINGKPGCYSENFLGKDDSFITFYRLYKNVTGRDLAATTSKMDYDDAIEYVLNFVKQQAGVDVHEYLANTMALDKVILNEDRHFNNLGLIYDEENFRPAPVFDNGKSFLIGNKKSQEKSDVAEKIKCAFSKCFSPSFETNQKYLKKWQTIDFDEKILHNIKSKIPENFLQILKLKLEIPSI